MFTPHDLLYIASVAALILAMPGPTNTLLFSSSVARGFSRSLVLVAAELVAYLLAISCWGFLLLKLLNDQAWIATTLKLGAAFYIAYLSLKIWKFEKSLTPESSITSRHVFITTLLNPKAFLFASFVMPPKVFTDCGVRPICAITGTPRLVRKAMVSAICAPPSSFTAGAPVSAIRRAALR